MSQDGTEHFYFYVYSLLCFSCEHFRAGTVPHPLNKQPEENQGTPTPHLSAFLGCEQHTGFSS